MQPVLDVKGYMFFLFQILINSKSAQKRNHYKLKREL